MTLVTPPPHRIYLLRHAKAGWAQPGERDFDRSLTDEGYAEAEIVADIAADRGFRPDLLVSSTAARCRQTADAIRRVIDNGLECRFVDELYNSPADSYIEMLAALRDFEAVMMVGHNPAIEEVLVTLVGEDAANSEIPAGYPTAGLAVIDYVDGPEGTRHPWQLTEFLRE